MKYRITSRDDWTKSLEEKFGSEGSIHTLSDTDVVDTIMTFGRAEIKQENNDLRVIEFQNGYD